MNARPGRDIAISGRGRDLLTIYSVIIGWHFYCCDLYVNIQCSSCSDVMLKLTDLFQPLKVKIYLLDTSNQRTYSAEGNAL